MIKPEYQNRDFGVITHRLLWFGKTALSFRRMPDRRVQPNEIEVGLHLGTGGPHYTAQIKWQDREGAMVRELNFGKTKITDIKQWKQSLRREPA
jgi:hypothetical protein